jgi:hypothetical protein
MLVLYFPLVRGGVGFYVRNDLEYEIDVPQFDDFVDTIFES